MSSNRLEVVAGGGLLHRRVFLAQTAGVMGIALMRAQPSFAQQGVPAWMKAPGAPLRGYGERSPYEKIERPTSSVPGSFAAGVSSGCGSGKTYMPFRV